MLRRSTSQHLARHHKRIPISSIQSSRNSILRSQRDIPKYTSDSCEYIDEEPSDGMFNVLNHHNHPGVVYYVIQFDNPGGSSSSLDNSNNNTHNPAPGTNQNEHQGGQTGINSGTH